MRPIYVFNQPDRVEVVSVGPDGPPIQFRWKDTHYVVHEASGPERIKTGWWRGSPFFFDYYVTQTTNGERFWLSRSADGTWFMSGIFA
jgi:protein ImuB